MITTILMSLAVLPQGPRVESPQFHLPVRLKAGTDHIKVEAPGYAAPCWHDLNGDGHKDLIVGQFADGKMQVLLSNGVLKEGVPTFKPSTWLQAEGAVAEVPGVW
jgi:hypothetical protein